jgi:hypothetical protein
VFRSQIDSKYTKLGEELRIAELMVGTTKDSDFWKKKLEADANMQNNIDFIIRLSVLIREISSSVFWILVYTGRTRKERDREERTR